MNPFFRQARKPFTFQDMNFMYTTSYLIYGSILNSLSGQNTNIALPFMRRYGTKPTSAKRLSSFISHLGCDYFMLSSCFLII